MSIYKDFVDGVKWICDYLEIPNYLLLKYKKYQSGENVYESEEHFWSHLLGPIFYKGNTKSKLHEGDIVVLKSFQLSQWIPRLPGLYWTHDWNFINRMSEKYLQKNNILNLHYEPYAKSIMVNGGLGILRLDTHDDYRIYGATSSGSIDASIPIICNKKLAQKIDSQFKKYQQLEVDIRGTIQRVPYTFQFNTPNIPRYCIHLDSFLNIKRYISDFRLIGNAWTIYRNPTKKHEKACGFCFAEINPLDEKSIIDATEWINQFIDFYTKGKGFPISDFDEIVPRFKHSIVPIKDLMSDSIDYAKLNSLFTGIDYRDHYQRIPRWF